MNLNESLRKQIGHQFENFVKECTFRGMDCTNTRYIKFSENKANTK